MKAFFGEFKEFAMKGSVIDLAVGILIGTAFTKVVNSLVTDIISPLIGLLLRKVNFSDLAVTVSGNTIKYGLFLDSLISFLITAFVIFLVIRQMNRWRRRRDENKDKV